MGAKKSGRFDGLVVEARKQINALDSAAQEALNELVAKGRQQQRELEGWLNKLPKRNQRAFKQWSKKAQQGRADLVKKWEEGRARLVEMTGVASQAQIKELTREIARLAKKIDSVAKKPTTRAELPA